MINWLIILILASSFPVGYLLAYLCKDELVAGRKWFIILAITSLIASLIIAFLQINQKLTIILTLFYLAIISLISAWKSYDIKNL